MSNCLDNIRVAIRVRPLIKGEKNSKENWVVDKNNICQIHDGKKVPNTAFTFDRIFGKEHSTLDLYIQFGKPIVLSFIEGISGTLFAYGQTSSGKTYTILGNENSEGVIRYAINDVFEFISKTDNREFLLRVSYMEIYNDVIRDLLDLNTTNLKLREDTNKEIFVDGLKEVMVTNIKQIIELIHTGEMNRNFGITNLNERTSRSHTIFRMVAESVETGSLDDGDLAGPVKVSHLNLVDMAGSERVSQTGAQGLRRREGSFINKSLFALANYVLNKLSDGERVFVPFRDSKLTRILQNSFGGNTKTSIICTVTPASVDETLSSLLFASRAKTIKNRPEVNEVHDDSTMLKRYRREISDLKLKLEKIQTVIEEQRRVAEETKAKLRELTSLFCTAQPKEKPEKQEETKAKLRELTSLFCTAQPKEKPEKQNEGNELLDSTISRELSMLAKLRRTSSVVQDLEEITAKIEDDNPASVQYKQVYHVESRDLKRKHTEVKLVADENRPKRIKDKQFIF